MSSKKAHVKIHLASVPRLLQPHESPFKYPSWAEDRGIEQDFLDFLFQESHHIVNDPKDADFIYLPVFWTRYHLLNNFGRTGLTELAEALEPALSMRAHKFTVCQYDDGPLVDLGDTTVYLGSRKSDSGRDAPLLASPIPRPRRVVRNRFKASFVGRINTHPIRQELSRHLGSRDDILFLDSVKSPRGYAKAMLSAPIALCPRGYGGSSFRFYEALQLGIVPWLIGEFDTRPFRTLLDWDSFSYYSPSVEDFLDRFDSVGSPEVEEKRTKVGDASAVLKFGNWPHLLIEELGLQLA